MQRWCSCSRESCKGLWAEASGVGITLVITSIVSPSSSSSGDDDDDDDDDDDASVCLWLLSARNEGAMDAKAGCILQAWLLVRGRYAELSQLSELLPKADRRLNVDIMRARDALLQAARPLMPLDASQGHIFVPPVSQPTPAAGFATGGAAIAHHGPPPSLFLTATSASTSGGENAFGRTTRKSTPHRLTRSGLSHAR